MNKDGSLNENAGPFQGQIALLPARMVQQLEADGVLSEGGGL